MRKVAFKDVHELEEYVAALVCVANADNDFSAEERRFIEGLVVVYSTLFPNAKADEIMSKANGRQIDDIGAIFKGEPVKSRMLIRDLIVLGHADGKYTEDERRVIRELADSLNIPQAEFEELQSAVVSQAEAEFVIDRIIDKAGAMED